MSRYFERLAGQVASVDRHRAGAPSPLELEVEVDAFTPAAEPSSSPRIAESAAPSLSAEAPAGAHPAAGPDNPGGSARLPIAGLPARDAEAPGLAVFEWLEREATGAIGSPRTVSTVAALSAVAASRESVTRVVAPGVSVMQDEIPADAAKSSPARVDVHIGTIQLEVHAPPPPPAPALAAAAMPPAPGPMPSAPSRPARFSPHRHYLRGI